MSKERRIVWPKCASDASDVANQSLLTVASIQELLQLDGKAITINAILAIVVAPCNNEAIFESKSNVMNVLQLTRR